MREIAGLDEAWRLRYRSSARDVADIALWENQIKYYNIAYSKAIEKVIARIGEYPSVKEEKKMQYPSFNIDAPSWKSVMVTRHLPERISGLERLCKNLWWCWNDTAKALFKTIDSAMWSESGHNPMYILDKVSIKRFNALADEDRQGQQL